MHASRLIELAAMSARHHDFLLHKPVKAEHWGADQYWVLSRARVIEWSRHLKCCNSLRATDKEFDPERFWKYTQPVLEEVFLSEVCTRVWCATLSIVDEHRLHGELDPISRSVFIANLEARRRALRLLLFARGLPKIATTAMNVLRRDCEAWTDAYLSQLSSLRVALQFCFERRRVQQLAREVRNRKSTQATAERYEFEHFGLRFAMATRTAQPAVCDELNAEIAASILACQPAHAFDGCGVPRPAWFVDGFQSDWSSIDILQDLCGNSARRRYDVGGGLMDRH